MYYALLVIGVLFAACTAGLCVKRSFSQKKAFFFGIASSAGFILGLIALMTCKQIIKGEGVVFENIYMAVIYSPLYLFFVGAHCWYMVWTKDNH